MISFKIKFSSNLIEWAWTVISSYSLINKMPVYDLNSLVSFGMSLKNSTIDVGPLQLESRHFISAKLWVIPNNNNLHFTERMSEIERTDPK